LARSTSGFQLDRFLAAENLSNWKPLVLSISLVHYVSEVEVEIKCSYNESYNLTSEDVGTICTCLKLNYLKVIRSH
jgi:hypothetical protein